MRGAAAPGVRLGPGLLRRGGEEGPVTTTPPRPLGVGTGVVRPQPGIRFKACKRLRVNRERTPVPGWRGRPGNVGSVRGQAVPSSG